MPKTAEDEIIRIGDTTKKLRLGKYRLTIDNEKHLVAVGPAWLVRE